MKKGIKKVLRSNMDSCCEKAKPQCGAFFFSFYFFEKPQCGALLKELRSFKIWPIMLSHILYFEISTHTIFYTFAHVLLSCDIGKDRTFSINQILKVSLPLYNIFINY